MNWIRKHLIRPKAHNTAVVIKPKVSTPAKTPGLMQSEVQSGDSVTVDLPSLCFWRILYGLYALLFGPSYGWIGAIPNSFFDPPILSLASLFSHLPSASFFRTLDAIILLLILMVTLGLFTRISTLLLFFALLTGNHFYYALGKIDHSILFVIVLPLMAFADWGRFFSVDSLLRGRFQQVTFVGETKNLNLFALIIAFGFFTAGFGKALTWLDFDLSRSGFLAWLFPGYFSAGRHYLLAPLAISVHPIWLWKFADIGAVIFELGFFVALCRRQWWLLWMVIAVGFHLVNCLLLNIPFLAHAIIYLCFVPWLDLFPRLQWVCDRTRTLLSMITVCCLFLATVRLQNLDEYQSIYQLLTGLHPQSFGFLATACGIWVGTMLVWVAAIRRTWQRAPQGVADLDWHHPILYPPGGTVENPRKEGNIPTRLSLYTIFYIFVVYLSI